MALLVYSSFVLLVLFLLALDLGVLNRKAHVIEFKEALAWTAFWVFLALLFNVFVYFAYQNHWLGLGKEVGRNLAASDAALKFLTGYVVEKSLSLDNIFVIALVFGYFQVPRKYQHRVLFWGILGALLMRGAMIGLGAALIHRFEWIIYVFGVLLLATAVRLFFTTGEPHPEENLLVNMAKKIFPVTHRFHEQHFFITDSGKKVMTPMFLALLVVESSDVAFAIDSIPAIFAITRDPFIVFTSNVFAILGLRSLYFALASLIQRFHYLKYSLVILLAFIAVKMLLTEIYPIPTEFSLIAITVILVVGIALSWFLANPEIAEAEGGS